MFAVCGDCGSRIIEFKQWVTWDELRQEYVSVVGGIDEVYCDGCEESVGVGDSWCLWQESNIEFNGKLYRIT